MKILVSEELHKAGMDLLRQSAEVDIRIGLTPKQLKEIISDYDGLVVRSQTKVTSAIIDMARKLQVIGRAGVGVDNIDVEAATRGGIMVINSPEANIVSTAEHTIAMLLALARHISSSCAQLQAGQWDRSVKGIQIRNKILGIIGMGRVGTEVAELALGLRMGVIAYDPMISESRTAQLGVEMVQLDDLISRADFITIHVPINPATKGLIGQKQLRLMKPTAMLINCARGGIVDEVALYEALENGIIAGAAVDVFSQEPAEDNILLKSKKVVATPHVAASTNEAEESASIDIAKQVTDVLNGKAPKSPVNIHSISSESWSIIIPYVQVGGTIGKIAAQIMEGQLISLSILYQGEIANENTSHVKAAILAGLLEPLIEERINIVNADMIASIRGIKVIEQKEISCENYTNLITVELKTSSELVQVAGSSLRGRTHIIKVNNFWFEIEPSGSYMLFTEHRDRPGMIGIVGTIIGNADINISQMQVSRGVQRGGGAMMVLCLDQPLTEDCHRQLQEVRDINRLLTVKLT